MIKRDELTDPNSCTNRAREDEALFVLRGHDVTSAATVQHWINRRIEIGKNKWEDQQIAGADELTITLINQSSDPVLARKLWYKEWLNRPSADRYDARVTLVEWVGVECKLCDGYGSTVHDVISTRLCNCCGGRGRVNAHGLDVALDQVGRVITEKRPWQIGNGKHAWLMREDYPGVASIGSAALPGFIFNLMVGCYGYDVGGQAKYYYTEVEADADYSKALIDWAKSVTGLSKTEEVDGRV